MAKKDNKVDYKPNIIVGLSNTEEVKILNTSTIGNEPFSKSSYKIQAMNKKGEMSNSVDLTYANGIVHDLDSAGEVIKLDKQAVQYKLFTIVNEKEGKRDTIIVDNRIKQPVKAFSKKIAKEGEQLQEGEDTLKELNIEDDFVFIKKPTLSSKDVNAILNILIKIAKKQGVYDIATEQFKNDTGVEISEENINDVAHLSFVLAEKLSNVIDRNDKEAIEIYRNTRNDLMDEAEEREEKLNIPSIKVFQDKNEFAKRVNALEIYGFELGMIRQLKSLLSGQSKLDDIKNNPTAKKLYEALLAYAKNNGIKIDIKNSVATNMGIDNNGFLVVQEDNWMRTQNNGAIYKDLGLNEQLKPYRNAHTILQKAFFADENAKTNRADIEKAINKLVDYLNTNKNDIGNKVFETLQKEVKNLSVDILFEEIDSAKKADTFNAVQKIANFINTDITRKFLKKNKENMFENFLRKDKKEIMGNSFSGKFSEGAFIKDADDENRYKAILINAKIPQLRTFGKKLFQKTLTAPVLKVYASEEGNLKEVLRGANISYYMKSVGLLGNVLSAIKNLNTQEELKDEVVKKLANYGSRIDKDKNTDFGLLGALKRLENSSPSNLSVAKVIKPIIHEIRNKMLENPKDAVEYINNLKSSKDENEKTLGTFIEVADKSMKRNAQLNSAYYAVANQDVKNAVIQSLSGDKEAFNKLSEVLKSKNLTAQKTKILQGSFGKLKTVLAKEIGRVNSAINSFNKEVEEKAQVDNVAKIIFNSAYSSTMLKSIGVNREKELYLRKNWFDNFRKMTDGVPNKELISFTKEVKISNKTIKNAEPTQLLYDVIKQRHKVDNAYKQDIAQKIKEEVESSIKASEQNKKGKSMNVGYFNTGDIKIDFNVSEEIANTDVAKEVQASVNESNNTEDIEKISNEIDEIDIDNIIDETDYEEENDIVSSVITKKNKSNEREKDIRKSLLNSI